MTGFINYLDLPLDPRLQALLDTWEDLRPAPDALPPCDAAAKAAFSSIRDHLTVVEIRPPLKPGTPRPRYFFVSDGTGTAQELGFDLSGRYLDDITEMPEFQTMLESDYDTVRASGRPRPYAEEHHLDNAVRRIVGIQFPFAADGRTVDHIFEVTYRLDLP